MDLDIRIADPRMGAVRDLVTRHLSGMHENSPPESVHALGIEALADPSVRFWAAWAGADLAGIGALKALDEQRAEIKSMRVADAFLGRGVGRRMLQHIVADARARGIRSVWLETGSTPEFTPAVRLYESEGFTQCPPFPPYLPDPFSLFLTLPLSL
jgi:putative acetyltransferase